jgi:ABC-2 type transport system ATP-binding protein
MEGLLSQAGEMTMVISSHELGEIESVTTHVGFLDAGKMLMEESMHDINARMREVRVTLDHAAAVPERWPKEWLQARAFGNVVSFVDTRYSQEIGARVRALLGPVRRIDAQPMPLRSVFTAMARAARDGAIP